MPKLRKYKVFISHCWEYDANYRTMVQWLNGQTLFRWKNLSVPEESALRTDKTFEKRLRKRLGSADVMLLIVGMEIPHRYWMQWEIKWARIRSIPIAAFMPHGAERVPLLVQEAGCPILRWPRDAVIAAVRALSK
ncbi:MAG TPA: TIR domain-containing protein [Phycisphaerales bacterium]|nr:TIR domain-containing protein [Phycisphaerales bacterium]